MLLFVNLKIYIIVTSDDSFKNHLEIFQYAKDLSDQRIEVNIGFTELSPDNIQNITDFFCEK